MAGELDAVPVAGPHAASMTAARHRSIVRTGNFRGWRGLSVQPMVNAVPLKLGALPGKLIRRPGDASAAAAGRGAPGGAARVPD